jgi:hypothetical protein
MINNLKFFSIFVLIIFIFKEEINLMMMEIFNYFEESVG